MVLVVAAAAGCTAGSGGDDDTGDDDDDGTTECPRPLAAADRVRYGAIGLPYTADADPSNAWEIVAISTTGGVTFGVDTFTMSRQPLGEVVFTPDGEVGLVAQDDGTIGVFTVGAAGEATVVHAGFEGSFYAHRVVMDPEGEMAWVLDVNFPENGGGLYAVSIGCDGSLRDLGLIAETKLFYDLELRSPGLAVAYAKTFLDAPFAYDLHKITLAPIDATGGVDAFTADDDAIVADLALTMDKQFALVADNNAFGTGNRIAVVDVVPATPTFVQMLTVEDPVSIAVSPFDDVVIVSSGFADAAVVVEYDAGTSPPFGAPVEMTYVGNAPELPGNLVTIYRGSLEGRAFLAELSGIRRLEFEGGGQVTDLGLVKRGDGVENIVGALGIPQ